MSKNQFARVLCDVLAHGLKAGDLLEADASLVKALAAEGSVDPHKDAVAHARSTGAPVVRSVVDLAAEAAAAKADALRIEIAETEDLLSKAQDDATKAALESKLAKLRAV